LKRVQSIIDQRIDDAQRHSDYAPGSGTETDRFGVTEDKMVEEDVKCLNDHASTMEKIEKRSIEMSGKV